MKCPNGCEGDTLRVLRSIVEVYEARPMPHMRELHLLGHPHEVGEGAEVKIECFECHAEIPMPDDWDYTLNLEE